MSRRIDVIVAVVAIAIAIAVYCVSMIIVISCGTFMRWRVLVCLTLEINCGIYARACVCISEYIDPLTVRAS